MPYLCAFVFAGVFEYVRTLSILILIIQKKDKNSAQSEKDAFSASRLFGPFLFRSKLTRILCILGEYRCFWLFFLKRKVVLILQIKIFTHIKKSGNYYYYFLTNLQGGFRYGSGGRSVSVDGASSCGAQRPAPGHTPSRPHTQLHGAYGASFAPGRGGRVSKSLGFARQSVLL